MKCEQAREMIGAVPDDTSAELMAHLHACRDCSDYQRAMRDFDVELRRALEFPVASSDQPASHGTAPLPPAGNVVRLGSEPVWRARLRRTTPFKALAASLLVGMLGVLVLWAGRPSPSLAAAVVEHLDGEPNSWSQSNPVGQAAVEAVLRASGVRLGPGLQPVVYARSCEFRGHRVPHFVVETEAGPVTVMILLHEHLAAEQRFSQDGYSGMLVPAAGGSIAVVSRTPMSLDEPARRVVHALEAARSRTDAIRAQQQAQ